VKVEKLIALGCLYPELVTLGSLDPRRFCGSTELNFGGVKLPDDSWEPPIKLWRLLQAFCTGSVTALKGPLVNRGILHCTSARGKYA
jgi:hypothetical protein